MEVAEQIKKFTTFIENNYHTDLLKAIRLGNKSLNIDFLKLMKFDIDLVEAIFEEPEEVIKAAEVAAEQLESHKLKIRLFNLPDSQNIITKTHLRDSIRVIKKIKRED